MKTALFGFCAALLAAVAPRPATAANALSLDGEWHYLVDVQKIGLNDYRNRPMRGTQDFFNRKGLVSDQGRRKAAFDVLKSWYEKR